MEKLYSRINFENAPSKKTPLNKENLDKMDSAINEIDNRVIELNGDLSNLMVETYDNAKKITMGYLKGNITLDIVFSDDEENKDTIMMTQIHVADSDLYITPNNGWMAYAYSYSDIDGSNPMRFWGDWRTEKSVIPKGTFYRLILANVDRTDISTLAFDEILSNYKVERKGIRNYINVQNFFKSEGFKFATIDDKGVLVADNTRITNAEIQTAPCDMLVKIPDGYKQILFMYHADGTLVAKQLIVWSNSDVFIPSGTHYRLLLARENDANMDGFSVLRNIEVEADEVLEEYKKQTVIERNNEAVNMIVASRKQFSNFPINDGSPSKILTFAHITDIHSDTKRYGNFIDFINGVNGVAFGICTGDFVVLPKDEEFHAISMHSNKTIYPVIGNHEASGTWQGVTYTKTPEQLMDLLPFPKSATKTYYSVDFEEQDVKLIVLNQYENTSTNYSQEQIDWFVEQLHNASRNDMGVVIGMHYCEHFPVSNDKGFYQRYKLWEDVEEVEGFIEDIVDAFKNGKTVTAASGSLSVNTSFESKGTFIAYMCGHRHADYIGYSSKYYDQLYLMCTCGSAFTEYCLGENKYNFGEEVSDLVRTPDTKYEDAFNIYSIDVANKLVKVIRVGADINDMMESRKCAVYNINI